MSPQKVLIFDHFWGGAPTGVFCQHYFRISARGQNLRNPEKILDRSKLKIRHFWGVLYVGGKFKHLFEIIAGLHLGFLCETLRI